MTEFKILKEQYIQLLDILARISMDLDRGADELGSVVNHKEVSFTRRAVSNSIGEIMKAVWEIEERFPDLKEYYSKKIKENRNQRG